MKLVEFEVQSLVFAFFNTVKRCHTSQDRDFQASLRDTPRLRPCCFVWSPDKATVAFQRIQPGGNVARPPCSFRKGNKLVVGSKSWPLASDKSIWYSFQGSSRMETPDVSMFPDELALLPC